MATRLSGFTRASSLGPIAEFMDAQGGSIDRVLRDVDLPFVLLEQPEIVVPLREQFRFLERAARETGDPYFGARLGQAVKSPALSAFGAWVCAADTLREAMRRAHAGLAVMLQTSTNLYVAQEGAGRLRWSIEFVEPETDGRHHNELLGVGYMMDTVRVYAGARWRPEVVMTALSRSEPRAELERILGCNVAHGRAMSSIVFDAALLDRRHARLAASPSALFTVSSALVTVPAARGSRPEPPVPDKEDLLATILTVAELAMHEGYPRIDWVASKLGATRRSLQRYLQSQGTSFNRVVEDVLQRHAERYLRDGALSVTEIALRLGYADPAHFTRAFRRWTGLAPSAFRQREISLYGG